MKETAVGQDTCWFCGEGFDGSDGSKAHYARGLHLSCYHRRRRKWLKGLLARDYGRILYARLTREEI